VAEEEGRGRGRAGERRKNPEEEFPGMSAWPSVQTGRMG
jgi:hypothetical protein